MDRLKMHVHHPGSRRWSTVAACVLAAWMVYLLAAPENNTGIDAGGPGASRDGVHVRPQRLAATSFDPAPTDDALGDIAGLFELSLAGDLYVDIDTKASLEMLSAEIARQRSPELLQRIENSLRAGLPPAAAREAMSMVHNFLAYSKARDRTMASRGAPESFQAWSALRDEDAALRRRYFDAATDQALFGAQEAYTRYAMDIQAIDADQQLSATAKAQRARVLYDQLAPDAAALGAPLSPATTELDVRIAALRQEGASDAQIQQAREPYLGREAASALRVMEMHNGLWADRYQAYARQKNAMLADRPRDPSGLVETLLSQHFEPEEIAAARAYDRAQEGR